MKILLIDDDEVQKTSFESSNQYDFKNEFTIIHTSDISGACELLLTDKFDAIIVDLGLDKTNIEPLGNQLIKIILARVKSLLIVYSGNIEKIDNSLIENLNECPFFVKASKSDTEPKDILQKVLENKQLLKSINDNKIEMELNNIFWNGYNDIINPAEKNKDFSFLKNYSATLLEHIFINEYDDTNRKIEGNMVYISPKFCKKITTGTIIKYNNNYYFVITPSCDIAQDKTTKIHLIKCEKLVEYATANKKKTDFITNLIKNPKNTSVSIYVLPKVPYFDDHKIINFHDLKIIDKSEITTANICCQIIPRIVQEIVSKFSSCYGRQGSPDYKLE